MASLMEVHCSRESCVVVPVVPVVPVVEEGGCEDGWTEARC